MGKRGRRLDVTASDMMELRNQGYSNYDIAKMLDIGQSTVQRYIGAQGKRMERLAAFKEKPTAKAAEEPTPHVEVYKPQAISEEYAICKSNPINITIDHVAEAICVKSGYGEIILDYDQSRELVQFLAWASRERCDSKESEEV